MNDLDFNPKYYKNRAGEVTRVEHTTALVAPRAKLPKKAASQAKELLASAKTLAGQTIEIHGQTSDGRRLCVTKSGSSAWLSVADLEAVKK